MAARRNWGRTAVPVQRRAVQGPMVYNARNMNVTMCPRPNCPNPTLYVARSGSSRNQQQYHCIGCWRRLTHGTSGQLRAAQQVRPPKHWLTVYSPDRLNGPAPSLVQPKDATQASIANMNSQNSRPVTVTSNYYNDDEDLISEARYGAKATFGLSTSKLLPRMEDHISTDVMEDMDFPEVGCSLHNNLVGDEESCERPCERIFGSTTDEVQISPIGPRALYITNPRFRRRYMVCSVRG